LALAFANRNLFPSILNLNTVTSLPWIIVSSSPEVVNVPSLLPPELSYIYLLPEKVRVIPFYNWGEGGGYMLVLCAYSICTYHI